MLAQRIRILTRSVVAAKRVCGHRSNTATTTAAPLSGVRRYRSSSSMSSMNSSMNSNNNHSTINHNNINHTPPPPRRRGTAPLPKSLTQQPTNHNVVSVWAVHVAQTLDIDAIVAQENTQKTLFGQSILNRQTFPNSILVQFDTTNRTTNTHGDDTGTQQQQQQPIHQYAALYRFGSIVYFNFDQTERNYHTNDLQSKASRPNAQIRSEQFEIVLLKQQQQQLNEQQVQDDNEQQQQPQQQPHHTEHKNNNKNNNNIRPQPNCTDEDDNNINNIPTVTGDYCLVDTLDMNNVAVISNIMAQTVALDSYTDIVDQLLHNFAHLNSTVSECGSFSSTDKSRLFQTVAQNNGIFIDMISKIGIKDVSQTAWKFTEYESIHYGLQEEFEIELRFRNIEFKLNLIQNNAKFFLEVMHHQKSNNLEWIIVVLILLECILMMVEMSGTGEAFFQSLSGTDGSWMSSLWSDTGKSLWGGETTVAESATDFQTTEQPRGDTTRNTR